MVSIGGMDFGMETKKRWQRLNLYVPDDWADLKKAIKHDLAEKDLTLNAWMFLAARTMLGLPDPTGAKKKGKRK